MKKFLNFLLETSKLKTMPRTGWVLSEVKNPETVAEHTFRMVITAWLLGEERDLNTKRIIKTALSHDLCEVYAGDVTPFFYYTQLSKRDRKYKKKFMKWVRLSKKEKEKRGRKKAELEKKSLLKLIKSLNPKLKKEIFSTWLDFEKRISKKGKFVKQVDKIETLLQSIEYFGIKEDVGRTSWWEGTEETVDDPLLLDFLAVIQNKFYGSKKRATHKITNKDLEKELEGILHFLVEIGKLKQLPRKIWRLLEVKGDLETVGSHIFIVSLMAWVFGKEKKELNMEKLLKMALCHEMPSVYTDDLTPYDRILPKGKKGRKEIFKKWLRLPRKEKEKIFRENYKKEKAALGKLTSKLKTPLKEEILQLWNEYRTTSTPEARFLNQVNVLAVLLQGLQYQKKDKNLPIDWLWEWAFEKCEDPMILKFMEELKKKFYGKRFIYKAFDFLLLKRKSNKK